MSPPIRSFIAVPSTEELRRSLSKLVGRLNESDADVRWERESEKFHITLVFLGNVDGGRLEMLSAALKYELSAHPPLDLVYEGRLIAD